MSMAAFSQECGQSSESLYESLSSLSFEELKIPDAYTKEKLSRELADTNFCQQSEADYSAHAVTLKMWFEMQKFETHYRRAEEEFLTNFQHLLDVKEKNIKKLGNLILSFRYIKRSTTAISLLHASLEFIYGLATFTRKLVDVDLDSKLPLVTLGIVSGLSIGGSVLALTYTRQTSENIFRAFKTEKSLLRELEMIFRKWNWIDKELEELLLPFKIDLKHIENIDLMKFKDEKSLKESVFAAIVLANFRRDQSIIEDIEFLSLVKTFVETPAAHMWLNRMKMRKLLNTVTKSLEDLLKKKTIAGDEDFLNHAALNLYPIFFPLFHESGNVDKARIFFGSIAGLSAVQTLGNSDEKEFRVMNRNYSTLLKDYKHVRKMSSDLIDEYD